MRAVFFFVVAVLPEVVVVVVAVFVVVVVLITAAGAVWVVRFRRRSRCFVGTVAALVVRVEAA